ncbi:hypothetical protein NC652_033389 [Populus alba x Populus x berolinensis]|uniref:Uncharacterized protein n=1 Tax=Populus alba x Populus x berolinensis TaxID=444605 RepID=A0AAD6Q079_9ROSI|nr:hypothetical protein NC652_033389 [Populus alba x Populus x berolinensis]KAJ6972980.1 hypothetical protein NC653_033344 [Populus alba x Populus x berolinensis]
MTFLMVSFSAKLSLLKGHISTCVSIGQAEYEYHFKHIVLPFSFSFDESAYGPISRTAKFTSM